MNLTLRSGLRTSARWRESYGSSTKSIPRRTQLCTTQTTRIYRGFRAWYPTVASLEKVCNIFVDKLPKAKHNVPVGPVLGMPQLTVT